jgi:peptide/nickel transport system ATP-binding protein
MPDDALLSVSHLSVRLADRKRPYTILPDLSFDLGSECVALVGESGSGKSLTARAVLNLLEPSLAAQAAHLRLGEVDLQRCSTTEWNRLRGARLSLMLQDPHHSLNPVLCVGRQLDLALRVHQRLPAAERRERIANMLEAVGLTQLQQVLSAYPHQLSGGMGQRVVLAMMLMNNPHVLIADEPTSALDVALREQVMELIIGHVRTRSMGLLLISHDLQMVARHADRALVMYRGRIVDQRPAAELASSSHPYTRALWASRPSGRTHGTVLPVFDPASIAGDVST